MLVVDVETSGLTPEKNSILSIGALDISAPDKRFYGECRIWADAEVNDEALEVNGFTTTDINDPKKKTEAELITEFLEWSPSFDRDFLQAAARRAELAWDLAHRTIDTHTLAYMHMVKRGLPAPIDPQHRRSNLDLDAILNYCGIPDEPAPHNALTGALCHAEVASRLLFDKKLLPEFDSYEIPWLGRV